MLTHLSGSPLLVEAVLVQFLPIEDHQFDTLFLKCTCCENMFVAVKLCLIWIYIFSYGLQDAEGGDCSANGQSVVDGGLTHGDDPCHVCICRLGQLECFWQQCGPAPQLCRVFDVEGRCNPSLYLCEIPEELVDAKDQLINAWPRLTTLKRTGRKSSRFSSPFENGRKLKRGSSRELKPTTDTNSMLEQLSSSPHKQQDSSRDIYFNEKNSVPGGFSSNVFSNFLRKARKTRQFLSEDKNAPPPDSQGVHRANYLRFKANPAPNSIIGFDLNFLSDTVKAQITPRRPFSTKSRSHNTGRSKGAYDNEPIPHDDKKSRDDVDAVYVQEYIGDTHSTADSNRISQSESRNGQQPSGITLTDNSQLNATFAQDDQPSNTQVPPIMNFDYDLDENIDLSQYAFPEFGRRLRRGVPDSMNFDSDLVKHFDTSRKRRVTRSTLEDHFERRKIQKNDSCRLLGVTYQIGEVIGVASDYCMQCRCASQAMFCSPRCCFYNLRQRSIGLDPATTRGPTPGPRRHPLHQYLQLTRAHVV